MEGKCEILQLSDCVMMHILSFLDATSLYNISRTCSYFRNIVKDPKLWIYIDGRCEPNTDKKVQFICQQFQQRTKTVMMRAESRHCGLVPQIILFTLQAFDNLSVLALENQRFDARAISLHDFPNNLEELSLKRTHVKNSKMFFHRSASSMLKLRVLILDECNWLDSSFIMSITKYPSLEILSLVKCMKVHINVVPYLNFAYRGCPKLKLIDSRFNTIANQLLELTKPTTVALYLQSMSSHELDTGKELLKRSKTWPKQLSTTNVEAPNEASVTNRHLEHLKFAQSDSPVELPPSVLYQDPYDECRCGWREKVDDPQVDEEFNRNMPIDDYVDNVTGQRFICRRHVRELNKLPIELKNFFRENQKKFYEDVSDTETDSDEDVDCCMFGVGRSRMIVLKVRETDAQGNIPEPEIIECSREREEPRRVIDINMTGRQQQQQHQAVPDGERPSTSSGSRSSNSNAPTGSKRPAESDANSSAAKRINLNMRGPPLIRVRAAEPVNPNPVPACRIHINIRRMGNNVNEPDAKEPSKLRLRRLSLRGYRGITDQVFENFRLIDFDLLDLTHTRVTKKGIEDYLQINPGCRVMHKNFCICKPIIPN